MSEKTVKLRRGRYMLPRLSKDEVNDIRAYVKRSNIAAEIRDERVDGSRRSFRVRFLLFTDQQRMKFYIKSNFGVETVGYKYGEGKIKACFCLRFHYVPANEEKK